MLSHIFWNGFLDEIQKTAAIAQRDLPDGVPISDSFAEFKKKFKPGDVFVSKPDSPGIKSRIIALRQFVGGNPHYRWSHSGLYLGNGKILHASIPLDGEGPSEVREESVDALNRGKLDVMILKPKAALDIRKSAISKAKKFLGLPYGTQHLVGVTLGLPLGNDPVEDPEALLCTAVPAVAYPQLEITKEQKSRLHLLPTDLINSDDFIAAAAYSQKKSNT